MKLTPEITFRGLPSSEALAADIQKKIDKLDRFFEHIMSCRVVIEAGHKHHHKGNLYHVRIALGVPGRELVVSRDPEKHQAHEDPYVAVRDAFDAARRQLEDYARQIRGDIKRHEPPDVGRVVELVPALDYGRIETPGGRSIYFHRNSLVNADFGQLVEGDEMRFAEEQGIDGPQASTVHRI
jgi:ribosome-associated translation inhibitor RaiA/cold shock CspA family protein